MATQKLYREGLLGKKLGMTHVYSPEGNIIPVTVIQAGPCFVLDVKSNGDDGYSAVQLGFEPKKTQRVSKAMNGHFAKAGKGAFYHVREVRCDAQSLEWNVVGKEIKVADVFKDGELVDVSGVSIGRGFSGIVRKFKAKGSPSTRGTHETRRHGGAIGCRKFPGHVFKNLHMPGQYGNESVTVQNLRVVQVKGDENLLLVRGAVPGASGALVVIRKGIRGVTDANAKKAA